MFTRTMKISATMHHECWHRYVIRNCETRPWVLMNTRRNGKGRR